MQHRVSMYMVRLGVMLVAFSALALGVRPAPFPAMGFLDSAAWAHGVGYVAFVLGLAAVIVSFLPKYSDKVEGFLEERPRTGLDAATKHGMTIVISLVFIAAWLRAVGGAVVAGPIIGYIVFFGGFAMLLLLLVLGIAGPWLIRWR